MLVGLCCNLLVAFDYCYCVVVYLLGVAWLFEGVVETEVVESSIGFLIIRPCCRIVAYADSEFTIFAYCAEELIVVQTTRECIGNCTRVVWQIDCTAVVGIILPRTATFFCEPFVGELLHIYLGIVCKDVAEVLLSLSCSSSCPRVIYRISTRECLYLQYVVARNEVFDGLVYVEYTLEAGIYRVARIFGLHSIVAAADRCRCGIPAVEVIVELWVHNLGCLINRAEICQAEVVETGVGLISCAASAAVCSFVAHTNLCLAIIAHDELQLVVVHTARECIGKCGRVVGQIDCLAAYRVVRPVARTSCIEPLAGERHGVHLAVVSIDEAVALLLVNRYGHRVGIACRTRECLYLQCIYTWFKTFDDLIYIVRTVETSVNGVARRCCLNSLATARTLGDGPTGGSFVEVRIDDERCLVRLICKVGTHGSSQCILDGCNLGSSIACDGTFIIGFLNRCYSRCICSTRFVAQFGFCSLVERSLHRCICCDALLCFLIIFIKGYIALGCRLGLESCNRFVYIGFQFSIHLSFWNSCYEGLSHLRSDGCERAVVVETEIVESCIGLVC